MCLQFQKEKLIMVRSVKDVLGGQKLVAGSAAMTVREAVKLMVDTRVGALPVLSAKGDLEGVFTERDVLTRVLAKNQDIDKVKLQSVMTKDPFTVPSDMQFGRALKLMYDQTVRHLPVIEGGKVLGVISARDALGEEWCDVEEEQEREDSVTALLR
jgi:CBS domain-containing protein